jgi:hypothetical protein
VFRREVESLTATESHKRQERTSIADADHLQRFHELLYAIRNRARKLRGGLGLLAELNFHGYHVVSARIAEHPRSEPK